MSCAPVPLASPLVPHDDPRCTDWILVEELGPPAAGAGPVTGRPSAASPGPGAASTGPGADLRAATPRRSSRWAAPVLCNLRARPVVPAAEV